MPEKVEKKRVAIVLSRAYFDSVPSLYNTALLLAKQGYLVDVFTRVNRRYVAPTFTGGNITLRVLGSDRNGLGRRQWFKKAIAALSGAKGAIINPASVWRLNRSHPYLCFIGVEPEGLAEADSLARFVRAPLAYYSLELLLSHELTAGDEQLKQLKTQEVTLSRKAIMTIIQDSDRARLLGQDNQIPLEKFVMVPNSPLGPAARKPSGYWHKKFNLSPEYRIVLHAGNLSNWTNIDGIIKSTASWPEKWVLVVHTRFNAHASEVERLRELGAPGRVLFSLEPVPGNEYETLVDGADVGIAFYVSQPGSPSTQQNIETIGLSSGKLAHYLRAGLPVIVNEIKPIGALVRDENCGICVAESDEIGNAIALISSNYDEYSRNAIRVFEERLNFSRGFQEVIKRLGALQ